MLRTISSHWVFNVITPFLWAIAIMILLKVSVVIGFVVLFLYILTRLLKMGFLRNYLTFINYYRKWPHYGKLWVYVLFLNDPFTNSLVKYEARTCYQYSNNSITTEYLYHGGFFKFIWVWFYKNIGYKHERFDDLISPEKIIKKKPIFYINKGIYPYEYRNKLPLPYLS